MADVAITGLPVATAADGTEVVPVVQGGTTKQMAVAGGATVDPLPLGTPDVGDSEQWMRANAVLPLPSALYLPGMVVFLPTAADADNTETALGLANSTLTLTDQRLIAVPVYFSDEIAIEMGAAVTTGGATSTIRVGLFNDNGASGGPGRPGTIAKDFGAVASTAAGTIWGATGSFTPIKGVRYWAVLRQEGGTSPTVARCDGQITLPNVAGGDGYGYRYDSSGTGAFAPLAATAPSTLTADLPRFRWRK